MTGIPPRVQALLDRATPGDVRFIKLGRKSVWWLARDTNTLNSLGRRDHANALILFITHSQSDEWFIIQPDEDRDNPGAKAANWPTWDEQLHKHPALRFQGKPRDVCVSKELGVIMEAMTAKEFFETYRTRPSLQEIVPKSIVKFAETASRR
jgi:hypothetical protein